MCDILDRNARGSTAIVRQTRLPEGWMCPKCGYVWSPWIAGCKNCNQLRSATWHTGIAAEREWLRQGGVSHD